MQDMTAVPHETNILRSAVNTLPVQDGTLKHVAELLPGAQEVRPDKVYHAPILNKVVLERVASQYHPSPGTDVLQGLGSAGMAILYPVSLITDNHIRSRTGQSLLNS